MMLCAKFAIELSRERDRKRLVEELERQMREPDAAAPRFPTPKEPVIFYKQPANGT